MRPCVIFAGGNLGDPAYLTPYLAKNPFLIAADSGLNHLLALSLLPDLVVGDMDSLGRDPQSPRWETLRVPAEKDETDTVLAIDQAISRGFSPLYLAGAMGGRFDHVWGNVQSLAYALSKGVYAALLHSENAVFPITWDHPFFAPRQPGHVLSLLAFSPTVTGVTTTGLGYPLTDETLTADFPRGVSNEWAAESATVTVSSGILLAILSRKD